MRLLLLVSLLLGSAASAEEMMNACPDMSGHPQVLEQGQKRAPSGGGIGHGFAEIRGPYKFDTLPSGAQNDANEFRLIPESEIRSFPLRTALDIMRADRSAYAYELVRRFDLASTLYQRILKCQLEPGNLQRDLRGRYVTKESIDATRKHIALLQPKLAIQKANSGSNLVMANSHITTAQKLGCLDMAHRLDETASKLEADEQYAMASRLYSEALEIRKKNLGENDPDTAVSYADLARVSAKVKHTDEADNLYRKAIAIAELNKKVSQSDYETILENYAQFLESIHKPDRAAQMYERVRALHKK